MQNVLKKTYRVLHRGSDYICKAISAISFGFVVLCTLTVLLQVINRYVIVKLTDYSATFTDELARFLLMWISYTAVAMCFREGTMAQVDMIYSRCGKKGRIAMYVLTRIVMGIVLYVIIRYGFWFAGKKAAYHSAMLNIPGNILYATVPIGGCLLAYEWLTEMIGVFAGEIEPFAPQEKRGLPEHNDDSDQDVEKLEAFVEEVEGEFVAEHETPENTNDKKKEVSP